MITNLFITVLNMSISGAAAALLLFLWRAFSRNHLPSGYRYGLWAVLFARLVLPVSPRSVLSIMGPMRDAASYSGGSAYTLSMEYIDYASIAAAGPGAGLKAVAAVWLAVAMLLVGFWIAFYLRAQRSLRYAVLCCDPEVDIAGETLGYRRPARVFMSKNLLSPIVIGFLRPRIIMPEHRPMPENSRYAIAHEMVHAHRGDQLIKAAFFLAAAVHWFNPLVWVSLLLLERDIESACDERVLRCFGEESRSRYASVLIDYAERRSRFYAGAVSLSGSSTAARIQKVIRYRRPGALKVLVFALVTLLIGVSAATSPVLQDKYSYIPDTTVVSSASRREIQQFVGSFLRALETGDAETVAAMSTADPEFFNGQYQPFGTPAEDISLRHVFYTSASSADVHLEVKPGADTLWLPQNENSLVLRVAESELMGGLYAAELHPLSRYNALGPLDREDEAVQIIEMLIKHGITSGANTPENAPAIAEFCMDMAGRRLGETGGSLLPAEAVESIALEFFLIEDCGNLRATEYFDPASDAYRFDGSIGTYFEYQIIGLQKTPANTTVTVEYYSDPLQTQREKIVKYTLERVIKHES